MGNTESNRYGMDQELHQVKLYVDQLAKNQERLVKFADESIGLHKESFYNDRFLLKNFNEISRAFFILIICLVVYTLQTAGVFDLVVSKVRNLSENWHIAIFALLAQAFLGYVFYRLGKRSK